MNPDEITAELRDIRPQVELPVPDAFPWLTVSLIVAALVLGVLVWWLIRRKKGEPAPGPATAALKELESLRTILGDADSERYAMAVSDVLRRYIERQFGISAVRQTTEEFLVGLASRGRGLMGGQREVLGRFLEQCDLVKFARGELGQGQRNELLEVARGFIEQSSKDSPAPDALPTVPPPPSDKVPTSP